MADKVNRRDEIVRVASELFIKEGYAATSVREISQKVGCTEAALYYHFKDGKRGLFKEVVETTLPLMLDIIEGCHGEDSLSAFVVRFAERLRDSMVGHAERFRWLISEYANFGDDERAIVYEKHLSIYQGMMDQIRPFVPDETDARQMAWTILCTSVGYMQLFCILNLKAAPHGQDIRLVDLLARALSLNIASDQRQ